MLSSFYLSIHWSFFTSSLILYNDRTLTHRSLQIYWFYRSSLFKDTRRGEFMSWRYRAWWFNLQAWCIMELPPEVPLRGFLTTFPGCFFIFFYFWLFLRLTVNVRTNSSIIQSFKPFSWLHPVMILTPRSRLQGIYSCYFSLLTWCFFTTVFVSLCRKGPPQLKIFGHPFWYFFSLQYIRLELLTHVLGVQASLLVRTLAVVRPCSLKVSSFLDRFRLIITTRGWVLSKIIIIN